MPLDDEPGRVRPLDWIVRGMVADGLDPNDPEAVDAWIDHFNELWDPERARGSGRSDEDDDRPAPLVVVVPDEAEARASAVMSPLLAHTRTLIDFLGSGRKATSKGNVTMADARRLVALLDTGDVFDPTVDGRTFTTRSALDLPNLLRIVRLGRAAGFIEHLDGKLVPTVGDRGLGDPLADLRRITEAVNRFGMVSVREHVDRIGWNDHARWMDDRFGSLVAFLLDHPVDEVTSFDELVERTFVELWDDDWMGSPHGTEARTRDAAQRGMATAVETLAVAGLVSWSGAELAPDPRGVPRPRGGVVALTPGGRWTVTEELVEVWRMPIAIAGVPQYTDLDFAEIVRRIREGPDDGAQFAVEVGAWLDRQGGDALARLETTARTSDDHATVTMALGVMGERFAESAEPIIRTLLGVRSARGAALVWLVDRDLEDPELLLDRDPAVFADVLAIVLERDGSDAMLDVFGHVGDADEQVEMLDRVRRERHRSIAVILTTLGGAHPSVEVARAARKAALQHRTMLAAPDS